MKKLLHERLREFNIGREDAVSLSSGYGLALTEYETVLLADEIERYYIPKEHHRRELNELREAQADSAHHTMKQWALNSGYTWDEGESITKWIDRRFIKKPVFEDGEPVQFGDEFIITHKEPDSLEKLRDDVLKWIARYSTSTSHETVEITGEEIADRLSALIERGA